MAGILINDVTSGRRAVDGAPAAAEICARVMNMDDEWEYTKLNVLDLMSQNKGLWHFEQRMTQYGILYTQQSNLQLVL